MCSIHTVIIFVIHLYFHVNTVLYYSYGGKLDDYPHPELDFPAFASFINAKNASTGQTWDPVKKIDRPWIDTKKLSSALGKKGCTIS